MYFERSDRCSSKMRSNGILAWISACSVRIAASCTREWLYVIEGYERRTATVATSQGDGISTTWSYRAGAGRAEAFLLNPQPLTAAVAHEWGVARRLAGRRNWPQRHDLHPSDPLRRVDRCSVAEASSVPAVLPSRQKDLVPREPTPPALTERSKGHVFHKTHSLLNLLV